MPKKIHTTSQTTSATKRAGTTRSARKATAKKTAVKKTTTRRTAAPKKQPRTTAPRTTPKRTPANRTNTAKAADKSSLVHAAPDTAFWVTGGDILTNLRELKDALAAMERTVFTHHVTKEKNDFADWVETVLRDGTCAAALRSCRTPQSAHAAVVRCLKVYRIN